MSFNAMRRLAEEKIKKAQENGELDNLPGAGEPLDLEEYHKVPEDLRMAYKVLKNAGYTPPELQAKEEIRQIEELLAGNPDETARYQAIKRLNYLTMKLGALRPDSGVLSDGQYTTKIAERLIRPK